MDEDKLNAALWRLHQVLGEIQALALGDFMPGIAMGVEVLTEAGFSPVWEIQTSPMVVRFFGVAPDGTRTQLFSFDFRRTH